VKSTLNTFDPPPKHVDAKIDPRDKLSKNIKACPKMDEVYMTFKKVSSVKGGYIDNKEPDTFNIKKKALPKNQKKNDFINQEHLLHLQSQQRRIGGMGSMVERKKNIHDPIAYPSYFFRQNDSDNKDITLDFMFSQVATTKKLAEPCDMNTLKKQIVRRPLSAQPGSMTLNTTGLTSKSPSKIIPNSAKSKRSKAIDEMECPKFTVQSEADYRIVKQGIIDLMIEYRIYKNEDLERMLAKVKAKNPHLDQQKLEDIYLKITLELDK